jgi:exosortase/archaeosortase family protein
MNQYIKKLAIRLLLLILLTLVAQDILYPILEFLTVKLSYLPLLPLKPVVTEAAKYTIRGQPIEIIPACIALLAYILLAILVLATKDIPLKKAVKMFLFGSFILLLINVIRIDLLVYLLIFAGKNLFESVHLVFWKIISGIVVVLVWVYLTRKYEVKTIPVYSDVKFLIRKIKQSRQ